MFGIGTDGISKSVSEVMESILASMNMDAEGSETTAGSEGTQFEMYTDHSGFKSKCKQTVDRDRFFQ